MSNKFVIVSLSKDDLDALLLATSYYLQYANNITEDDFSNVYYMRNRLLKIMFDNGWEV